jgi:hypothetical protein
MNTREYGCARKGRNCPFRADRGPTEIITENKEIEDKINRGMKGI